MLCIYGILVFRIFGQRFDRVRLKTRVSVRGEAGQDGNSQQPKFI